MTLKYSVAVAILLALHCIPTTIAQSQCCGNNSSATSGPLGHFKCAFPNIPVLQPVGNYSTGHANQTECCIQAIEYFLSHGCQNSSQVNVNIDLFADNTQFPCGELYNGNNTGAPEVQVTYTWAQQTCPGWQLSKSSDTNQWSLLLVGFILPPIVFGFNIPRPRKLRLRRSVRLPKALVFRISWQLIEAVLAAVVVVIDAVIWFIFIFAFAGPILLSLLLEAWLDKRVLDYLQKSAESSRIPLGLQAKMLFTVLTGNLVLQPAWSDTMDLARHLDKLDKQYLEDRQETPEAITGKAKTITKVGKRLSAMLACQSAFGPTIAGPIVFFLGSFVYAFIDMNANLGEENVAEALAFGQWWFVLPHTAVVSGCLLAGNNPNILEGIVSSHHSRYEVGEGLLRCNTAAALGPEMAATEEPATPAQEQSDTVTQEESDTSANRKHDIVINEKPEVAIDESPQQAVVSESERSSLVTKHADKSSILPFHLERVYDADYRPVWPWNRGPLKLRWLLILFVDSWLGYEKEGDESFPSIRCNLRRFLIEVVTLSTTNWVLLFLLASLLLVLPFTFAFLTAYHMVPIGLGCHSLTFLIYICAQSLLLLMWISYYLTNRDKYWIAAKTLKRYFKDGSNDKLNILATRLKNQATEDITLDAAGRDVEKGSEGSRLLNSSAIDKFQLDIKRDSVVEAFFWCLCSIAFAVSFFVAVAGNLMQLIGVYRNNLCLTTAENWGPAARANAWITLSTDTYTAIHASTKYWNRVGACSTAFLATVCYVGWIYQQRLREKFKHIANNLGRD